MSKTLKKEKSINTQKLAKKLSKKIAKKLSKRIKRKNNFKIKDRGSAKKKKGNKTQKKKSTVEKPLAEKSSKNFLELTVSDISDYDDKHFNTREAFHTLLTSLGFTFTGGDEALHVYAIKVTNNGVFDGFVASSGHLGIRISQRIGLVTERRGDLRNAVRCKDELLSAISAGKLIEYSESKLRSLGFQQAKAMVNKRDKQNRSEKAKSDKLASVATKKDIRSQLKEIRDLLSKQSGISESISTIEPSILREEPEKEVDEPKAETFLPKVTNTKPKKLRFQEQDVIDYVEEQFSMLVSEISDIELEEIKTNIITHLLQLSNQNILRSISKEYNKLARRFFPKDKLTLFYTEDTENKETFKQAFTYFKDNVFIISTQEFYSSVFGIFKLYIGKDKKGLINISLDKDLLHNGLPYYINGKGTKCLFKRDNYSPPSSIISKFPKILISSNKLKLIVKCNKRYILPEITDGPYYFNASIYVPVIKYKTIDFILSPSSILDPSLSEDDNTDKILKNTTSKIFGELDDEKADLLLKLDAAISNPNLSDEELLEITDNIKSKFNLTMFNDNIEQESSSEEESENEEISFDEQQELSDISDPLLDDEITDISLFINYLINQGYRNIPLIETLFEQGYGKKELIKLYEEQRIIVEMELKKIIENKESYSLEDIDKILEEYSDFQGEKNSDNLSSHIVSELFSSLIEI